ncbi:MFS transporter [Oscillibacter ruminantium]|jgi:PPP family 3-phenylpropionic acid transporter|uniref:MFS transporter n=1 Tax=Oscillibacter ruminantium TaxID=1263547 RepID=UPI0002F060B9|nr:MFS transporter [Oscillibacter ruminantium]MDN0031568.1 MFS transporter [Oscillibacter valericigenes]MEA5041293.1 MFS transporter [Oscillibacter ruminantium]
MSGTSLPSGQRVNTMYFLLQIWFWGMMAAFTGYQTAIVLNRGFSSGQAGVFISLGCLSGIFAQPLLGAWADRHPAVPLKRIFGGCMLAALLIHGGFYFSRPGFFGTALIFLALGALETNAYPLIDAMAMQFLNAGIDVRYSLGRGLGAFAYAIVSVLVGQQARRFGVESALVTHGALVLLILTTLAVFPAFAPSAAPAAHTRTPAHSPFYILKHNPAFTVMLLAGFFGLMAVMPIVNFLVSLVNDRGGDSGSLGLALFLMAASELPGAILFQWLWKKTNLERIMVISAVFMALKPLLFLFCGDLRLFLMMQPIQMLGYGLFTPGNVFFANENVPPEDRIQGQSLKMVATNGLSGVVGNLIAGGIIDRGGVNAMLVFCFFSGAIGVALAFWAVRLRKFRKSA